MVKVSKDFRQRLISPATRQSKAAVQRSSSGCQADAMFPERWLAGNFRQTRRSRLGSQPVVGALLRATPTAYARAP
eukprot:16325775-Heterocapsa_arctica.AAC.1